MIFRLTMLFVFEHWANPPIGFGTEPFLVPGVAREVVAVFVTEVASDPPADGEGQGAGEQSRDSPGWKGGVHTLPILSVVS